jgi:hypothetical protein
VCPVDENGVPFDPPPVAGVTTGDLDWARHEDWYIYVGTLWPASGCCAEPMPCRKELQEQADQDAVVRRRRAHDPNVCLACGGPLKSRQRVVTYPGENLLVPGAPPARFHAAEPRPGRFALAGPANACRVEALAYERRWMAVDPHRPELAARPACPGRLLVHADGYTSCRDDGSAVTAAPGCMGEMTHRHTGAARWCAGNCSRTACVGFQRAVQSMPPGIWTPRPRWTLEDYQRWELPTGDAEQDTLLGTAEQDTLL